MEFQKGKSSEIIFVLGLFGFYTLCALFLTILGAKVYQQNVENTEFNYTFRTTVLYITEKVRQGEIEGGVEVGATAQSDALVVSKDYDGTTYKTWIYVEDGYLKEVLLSDDMEVQHNIGQKIIPLSRIDISFIDDNLLAIDISDIEGNKFSSNIYLEAFGKGGA